MLNDIKKTLTEADRLITKKIPLITFLLYVFFLGASLVTHFFLDTGHYLAHALIILFLMTLLMLSTYLFITRGLTAQYKKNKTRITEEFDFLTLVSENINELLVLLDEFGKIININTAFGRLLNIDTGKALGKPFRDIFNLTGIDTTLLFKKIILDNMNEVFRQRATEFILPIKLPEYDDNKSIYFKLMPITADNNLKQILAIGRLLGSDYITNKWLDREKTSYVMDNNVSFLLLFCHRLTRNLEGKLDHNDIVILQIALQEILVNAVEHGNLAIDFDTKTEMKTQHGNYLEQLLIKNINSENEQKKVFIDYSLDDRKVIYSIRDEGKGFDWRSFMSLDLDIYSHEMEKSFHGVGIQIVKSAFDDIRYNDKGNEVTLIKYLNRRDSNEHNL